jgi:hypothetical protein
MLLLQKDRTYGKGLLTRTGGIIKAEEGGPGKICLYHNQSTHQGAERKFYEDGHGGQRWGGFLKQRTRSMSVSPFLSIKHVQVAQIKNNTMAVDILISGDSLGQKKSVETTTLLDTKAGGKFIDQNFVQNQKIEMKESKYPIKVFNVDGTPNKRGTITKYTQLDLTINENLEKGYIQPSQLPQASSFFFVKKKDGRLQPCQDYWYLNDWTVKNAYPLPLISEIMDKLKEAKYFSKFDIWWGYNKVPI